MDSQGAIRIDGFVWTSYEAIQRLMGTMRIAVLSDIHGNMDAFEKVLEDLDRFGTDEVYCLGDSIGYGPEPERVIQTLRRRGIPSVMGNHELAAADPGFLSWFNPAARQSLIRTFALLSIESLSFVQALPRHISAHSCRFVHGFPPDSPTLYLFQVENRRQRQILDALPEQIFFIGHTHLLDILAYDGSDMTRVDFQIGSNALQPHLKYLVNIGAVGQPRDGDPRAKYVIWDSVARRLDIRCVPYDAQAAAAKIRAAGLPESHARRLLDPG
jgi:diadenosine tetraphosphatase ApaH/serine/threonine PP2A family protein phosphatase